MSAPPLFQDPPLAQERAQRRASYSYWPLKEFRLLDVEPAPFDDAEIKCTLTHKSLGQRPLPSYETISYCWGDAAVRADVVVNGQAVSVPASTATALRHMRSEDTVRTLWIDAMCINQEDLDERSYQVTLMGEIFRNSTRNLVFLGEEDEVTEPALQSIRNIVQEASQHSNNFEDFWQVVYDYDLRAWTYSSSKLETDINVDALTAFFSKPWFSRLWVIQETALAPYSVCVCGPHTIDFLDVVRATIWLQHKSVHVPQRLLNSAGVFQGAGVFSLVDPNSGCNYRISQYVLAGLSLFELQQSFKASDPKDRVFSLLELQKLVPLSAEQERPMSEEKRRAFRSLNDDRPEDGLMKMPKVIPDYTLSVDEVFRDATKRAVRDRGIGVEILRHINHAPETVFSKQHPSWLPYWGERGCSPAQPALLSELFAAHNSVFQPLEELQLEQDPAVLRVRGLVFDAIQDCTATLQDVTATNVIEWIAEAERMTAESPNDVVLGTTLLGGLNREQRTPSDADALQKMDLVQYCESQCEVPPPFEDLYNTSRNAQVTKASRFYAQFKRTCRNRKFFVTESGHPGVGPKLIQKGDVVVVLYGARTPFILRPHGEDWYILGECYVDSIMFGKAVQESADKGVADQAFTLR